MTGRSTSPTPRIYLMTHKPELGIKSPYELNEDQYKAALDLLRAQRTLVGRYWHDAFIQIDDFKNEGVVASGSWPFQVNLLKAEKQPVASVFPEEGVTGWADTTMMHVDSAIPTAPICGWSIRSLPRCRATSRPGSAPIRRFPPPAQRQRAADRGRLRDKWLDDFEKIKFWTTPTSKCASQNDCVPYYRWVSDYIGVIGGR